MDTPFPDCYLLAMGKRTLFWEMTRKKLKREFAEKGIVNCEAKLEGCWYNNGLSFAHRHKRKEYWSRPDMLGNHNQVILACAKCHNQMEDNKELTKQVFERLRGDDLLDLQETN